jgi:hypothetical protein
VKLNFVPVAKIVGVSFSKVGVLSCENGYVIIY